MTDDVYTHGHHESVLRSHRWRTAENSAGYLLPHLRPGDRLLDVGCGPGTITVDLASRVAPGDAIGIDAADDVVAEAVHAAESAGCPNVTFARGDAYSVAAAAGTFDVVHAHQVLQHLGDPIAALTEMRRVLGPAVCSPCATATTARSSGHRRTTASTVGCSCTTGSPSATVRKPTPGAGCLPGCWPPGSPASPSPARRGRSPTAADRDWWGRLWADRVRFSSFATQAKEYGLSDEAELEDIAAAFESWATAPEGVFV